MYLTVNDTTKKDSFRTICKNQPIVFNGNTINVSGIYKDTFTNSNGCDSFLYLHLTVNDTTKKDSFRTICKNQSVIFNGNTFNVSGTYKDTFTNAKGCDSFLYLHLNVLDTPSVWISQSICTGDSFLFNNIHRKISGTYKDTFTNFGGCDSFVYLNLTVHSLPIANAGIDTLRVNCEGDSVRLGSQTVNNYSYSWSPNFFLSNPNLAQPWSKTNQTTTYYLIVQDNLTGCKNSDTVNVTIKPSYLNAKVDLTNLICFQDQSGTIGIKAGNGYPNYQYKLSQTNYKDTGVFTNLSAGLDQFTVRDLKGCLYSDTFTLFEPPQLKFDSVRKKNLSCFQSSDGEIQVYVSGGVRPYSYQWDRTSQISSSTNNLEAGAHMITITDDNNCLIDQAISLSEPSPIRIIDTNILPNPCSGDSLASIDIQADGGTQPYRYLWSNGKIAKKISNLKQGDYNITITDTLKCKDSFKITIKDSLPLKFEVVKASEINCEDFGTIELSAKGGKPKYLFSIDSGKSYTVNRNFKISEARLYHIQVKDANNCKTNDTTRVNGTERIEIQVYPKDTLVGLGEPVELAFRYLKGDSTKVQSFIWKPSDGLSCTDCRQPIASPYVPMLYSIEVTYNVNCYDSDTARIRHTIDELFIPNAFTPEGPNIENQTLRIYSKNIYTAKLSIFNRWGEKIFESNEAHRIGWDGSYKGEKLKYDVFVYSAEVVYLDGRKVIKAGDVTLVR